MLTRQTLAIPTLIALGSLLAACNSESGSSNESTDPNDDSIEQTDPDPNDDPVPVSPSLQLEVSAVTSGLELDWSGTGASFTAFNLCLATEAIGDQFAQCSALTGGDYRTGVNTPLMLNELEPSVRYWVQVEGERAGETPVYSSVRVGVPLVPDNAETGDAIEVVEEAFFGTSKPRNLNRAGLYALITDTSTSAGFWSSLGTEATTEYIAVEGPGGEEYEALDINLQSDYRKTLTLGDQLYFTAERTGSGLPPLDIWATDGTSTGTQRLVDGSVLNIALLRYLVEVDGKVGFVAFTTGEINADRFYIIDETEPGGAWRLPDVTPYNGGVGRAVIGFKGAFYVSQTQSTGRRLLKVDADTLDDELFWTMPNFSSAQRAPSDLTTTEDHLYFVATDGGGQALWRTDGVADPERLFNPNPQMKTSSSIQEASNPIRVGDRVFFYTKAWDPDRNPPDWQPNSKLAVAGENGMVNLVWGSGLEDILNANSFEGLNMDMHSLGDRLLFKSSIMAADGRQWWLTEGTLFSTERLSIDAQPIDAPMSGPPHYFSANSERGVWITNDDREQLFFVGRDPAQSEAVAGSFNIIDNLVEVAGQLWFTASAEFNGPISVWRVPVQEAQE